MDRLRRQPVSHYQLARNSLELMSHAKVLLTAGELREALCVTLDEHKLCTSRLTPFPIILNACLGFINNDNPSGLVEFFHATFQKWLLASAEWQSEPQPDIGQICLTYLMLENFSEPCKNEDLAAARRQQYPFAAYASRFWADHIRGQAELNLQEPLPRFLTSRNGISSIQLLQGNFCRDFRSIGKLSEWLQITDGSAHIAPYFCVCLGLQKTLDAILQRELEPFDGISWSERYSPLHAALILRAGPMCVTSAG
jgi:hypothetical protein